MATTTQATPGMYYPNLIGVFVRMFPIDVAAE